MKHLYMSKTKAQKIMCIPNTTPEVLAGENLPTISLVITEVELLLKKS